MRYESAARFRQALEQRLGDRAKATGASVVRLRKTVVFERLLARLAVAAPGRWVLKGGLALDFRLKDRSRTTRDMDRPSRRRGSGHCSRTSARSPVAPSSAATTSS